MVDVQGEVLLHVGGQGSCEGSVSGVFQRLGSGQKGGEVAGCYGHVQVPQEGGGIGEGELDMQLPDDVLHGLGGLGVGEMAQIRLEGGGDEGGGQAQRHDVDIEGGAEVVEEDVTDGGGHLDEHQGQGGGGSGRAGGGGGGFGVPQQQGVVGLGLVLQGDVDAAGELWTDGQALAVAVDPSVVVAQQVPGAALQRAQRVVVVVAVGLGRVAGPPASAHVDTAQAVALQLVAQTAGMGVEGGLLEQRVARRVQRRQAVQQVAAVVERVRGHVGHVVHGGGRMTQAGPAGGALRWFVCAWSALFCPVRPVPKRALCAWHPARETVCWRIEFRILEKLLRLSANFSPHPAATRSNFTEELACLLPPRQNHNFLKIPPRPLSLPTPILRLVLPRH